MFARLSEALVSWFYVQSDVKKQRQCLPMELCQQLPTRRKTGLREYRATRLQLSSGTGTRLARLPIDGNVLEAQVGGVTSVMMTMTLTARLVVQMYRGRAQPGSNSNTS